MSSPPGDPVPPVEEMVMDPFEEDAMVTLLPAMRYDVPSVSLVREPLRPVLCLVTPVKVVPLTVAITESSIERVTSPEEPPPSRPVPALTAVMSPPPPPVEDIVNVPPGPPSVNVMFVPAVRRRPSAGTFEDTPETIKKADVSMWTSISSCVRVPILSSSLWSSKTL